MLEDTEWGTEAHAQTVLVTRCRFAFVTRPPSLQEDVCEGLAVPMTICQMLFAVSQPEKKCEEVHQQVFMQTC